MEKKGILDKRVLEAMLKVPRHFFFDHAFLEQAYTDKAFPIGEGQTISQPYTVAYQTQLLHINAGQKVLEIGTGSGYQTCVLLKLGASVYTIEREKNLYERASRLLPELGYEARFFLGDGSKGLSAYAPYDKILVTAGAPSVPAALLGQLTNGGLIVIPVGDEKSQKMQTILKVSDTKHETFEMDTFRFVPLKGDQAW